MNNERKLTSEQLERLKHFEPDELEELHQIVQERRAIRWLGKRMRAIATWFLAIFGALAVLSQAGTEWLKNLLQP